MVGTEVYLAEHYPLLTCPSHWATIGQKNLTLGPHWPWDTMRYSDNLYNTQSNTVLFDQQNVAGQWVLTGHINMFQARTGGEMILELCNSAWRGDGASLDLTEWRHPATILNRIKWDFQRGITSRQPQYGCNLYLIPVRWFDWWILKNVCACSHNYDVNQDVDCWGILIV